MKLFLILVFLNSLIFYNYAELNDRRYSIIRTTYSVYKGVEQYAYCIEISDKKNDVRQTVFLLSNNINNFVIIKFEGFGKSANKERELMIKKEKVMGSAKIGKQRDIEIQKIDDELKNVFNDVKIKLEVWEGSKKDSYEVIEKESKYCLSQNESICDEEISKYFSSLYSKEIEELTKLWYCSFYYIVINFGSFNFVPVPETCLKDNFQFLEKFIRCEDAEGKTGIFDCAIWKKSRKIDENMESVKVKD